MNEWNTQCYLDSTPKGLLPLAILKIKIGSVVIEGNTAKKKKKKKSWSYIKKRYFWKLINFFL